MKHAIVIAAAVLLLTTGVNSAIGQAGPYAGTRWTAGQLDQLTAPIALYPDELLGSILAASTYPLEVVEAARWLDDPAHAALEGEDLAAALDAQSWDASVKSLVPFPAVLHFMDSNLEWMEQLGDAFLAQRTDLMDSVQRLRQRALAQGALRSTPQQLVASDQNLITIEPANPDVVYVPYYVPAIYGPWPWPDYPPYFFGLPPGVAIGNAFIGFGIGIGIGIFEPRWGWYGCNWHGHGIEYRPPYPHRPGIAPGVRPPYPRPPPQAWQHDPHHRGGVPYRDAGTAARYQGAEAGGRHEYRGYPPPATPARPSQPPQPAPRESRLAPIAPGLRAGGAAPTPPAPQVPQAPMPRPSQERPAAPGPRAAPPAFESFGRGPRVRDEAARGSASRSAPAAPAGGGGHPGQRQEHKGEHQKQ